MIYKTIAKQLRYRINSDEFAVGDVLPTEKQLMEEYGASRVSVRRAIEELVGAGLVQKRHGSGTYVMQKDVVHFIDSFKSGKESVQAMGKEIQSEVLQFAVIPAEKEVAGRLELAAEAKVYHIQRLRKIGDRPQILEESFMPVALFPELSIKVLEKSKYEYLERQLGVKIDGSFQEFAAMPADKETVRLLNLKDREPVLQITALARMTDGTPFDYSISRFKSSEYHIGIYLHRESRSYPYNMLQTARES